MSEDSPSEAFDMERQEATREAQMAERRTGQVPETVGHPPCGSGPTQACQSYLGLPGSQARGATGKEVPGSGRAGQSWENQIPRSGLLGGNVWEG